MTTAAVAHRIDPKLDLVFERIVDAPRELVWAAWTQPEHLKKWFTPAPYSTVECEIDLRAGGIFRTVMRSPEGELFPNLGCYLEVVENERLVWTIALQPGYRPAPADTTACGGGKVPLFTAIVTLEPHGKGTKYTAVALHRDEEAARQHDELGFQEGWGAACDQLVELVKKM
jgi:uncharacterized protein YndB with AHSA1/START domain